MTPERMRQYGKGLGLWQDKRLASADPSLICAKTTRSA